MRSTCADSSRCAATTSEAPCATRSADFVAIAVRMSASSTRSEATSETYQARVTNHDSAAPTTSASTAVIATGPGNERANVRPVVSAGIT